MKQKTNKTQHKKKHHPKKKHLMEGDEEDTVAIIELETEETNISEAAETIL